MFPTDLIGWLVVLVLLITIISSAVRVLYEYQRGVVFRLGRFAMVKGPGLRFIIPVVDKIVKVSKTLTADQKKRILKDYGWAPADDKYADRYADSDPVYAVWGSKA